eukprot:TRINITY_DN43926_c0_g1_i1.p1 TRINITY_DN43926_c0_g1~~TRINITY_DN43926_c0_g1_i1.p1  ORF type:complete len:453 (-),score=55.12 TRINITY_DN43926_c0_g1_i1:168-1466(-)
MSHDVSSAAKVAASTAAAVAVTFAAFSRYMRSVKVPRLVCAEDAVDLQRLLLDEEGGAFLREPYWPHILHWHWITSSSLAAVRSFPVPLTWRNSEEVNLTLDDGGTVSLDWWEAAPKIDSSSSIESPGHTAGAGRPVVLVLPGMANSSRSLYVRRCMDKLCQAGFRPVALNYRGVEHLELTSPRLACADSWKDLAAVIDAIKEKCPNVPIVAAAFSMGGTMLSKYLGETGVSSGIVAAVTVSAPLSYPEHMRELERRPILNFAMALPLKLWLWSKRAQIARLMPQLNLWSALRSRSLLELAGTFLPIHGYASVEDYFHQNDPEPGLASIVCPVLFIAAKDDPLVVPVPRNAIRSNRNLLLLETPGGGHLGWAGWAAGGLGPSLALTGTSWADSACVRFLDFHLRRRGDGARRNAGDLGAVSDSQLAFHTAKL